MVKIIPDINISKHLKGISKLDDTFKPAFDAVLDSIGQLGKGINFSTDFLQDSFIKAFETTLTSLPYIVDRTISGVGLQWVTDALTSVTWFETNIIPHIAARLAIRSSDIVDWAITNLITPARLIIQSRIGESILWIKSWILPATFKSIYELILSMDDVWTVLTSNLFTTIANTIRLEGDFTGMDTAVTAVVKMVAYRIKAIIGDV